MSARRSRAPASALSGAPPALASLRSHGASRAGAGKLAGAEVIELVVVTEVQPLARRCVFQSCAPVPEPVRPAPAPSVGRVSPGLVAGARARGAPRRYRGTLQVPGGVRWPPGAFP